MATGRRKTAQEIYRTGELPQYEAEELLQYIENVQAHYTRLREAMYWELTQTGSCSLIEGLKPIKRHAISEYLNKLVCLVTKRGETRAAVEEQKVCGLEQDGQYPELVVYAAMEAVEAVSQNKKLHAVNSYRFRIWKPLLLIFWKVDFGRVWLEEDLNYRRHFPAREIKYIWATYLQIKESVQLAQKMNAIPTAGCSEWNSKEEPERSEEEVKTIQNAKVEIQRILDRIGELLEKSKTEPQNILDSAEEEAQRVREDARKAAERLLEEAEQKAENLRKEAQIRAEATRERYKNEAEEILRTLKSSAVCDKEE